MSQTADLARYEALDPLAKRYVEVAARTMYDADRGLDGQSAGPRWEDVAKPGNGKADADTVAQYRVKAFKVVEALATVTREEPAEPVATTPAKTASAPSPVAPPAPAMPPAASPATATVDLAKAPKDAPVVAKTPEPA